MDEYTVGKVAELARVSVRTLHHYDEIGLLSPSERSAAGYRLYSAAELRRLQRITCWSPPTCPSTPSPRVPGSAAATRCATTSRPGGA